MMQEKKILTTNINADSFIKQFFSVLKGEKKKKKKKKIIYYLKIFLNKEPPLPILKLRKENVGNYTET